jgi:hypothetical protein
MMQQKGRPAGKGDEWAWPDSVGLLTHHYNPPSGYHIGNSRGNEKSKLIVFSLTVPDEPSALLTQVLENQ